MSQTSSTARASMETTTKKDEGHELNGASSQTAHHDLVRIGSTEANALPDTAEEPRVIDLEMAAIDEKQPPLGPMDPASFPDGGFKAWLVVFGAFCCLFCSFGWINCIGVFQEYYQTTLLRDLSPSTISWIPSLETFSMFAGGPVFGKIFDNYGPQPLLILGSFFHVFGLMMASLSTQYYQLILAQGICSPLGASAVFYPAVSSIATWFFRRRALAFGIVASGSSLGGVIFPILVQRLIPRIGFPWAMRVAAFMILGMLTVANLTVKSRLPPSPSPVSIMAFVRPLAEPAFGLLVLASFLVFFGLFLPFNFVILQALTIGTDPDLASYLLAILNAVSILGRTLPGWLGDRYGRFNVLTSMNFFSGIIALALWLPSKSTAPVVVFAALYGFSSGAFVGMIPACIAQISDIRQIGVRTGTLFACVSIAALCGNPLGGALLSGNGGDFSHVQIFCGVVIIAGSMVYLAVRYVLVGWKLMVKV